MTNDYDKGLSGDNETTEIIHGQENIIRKSIEEFNRVKERFDNCIDFMGPSLFFNTPIGAEFIKLKDRGIKLRFLTEITKDNIGYCKHLMEIVELRHFSGIIGNFEISDGKEYGSISGSRIGLPPVDLIRSNVKTFVQQQQLFFDMLWSQAMPAEQKIKELENGYEPTETKIVENPEEMLEKIIEFTKKSKRIKSCTVIDGIRLSYNNYYDLYIELLEKYRIGKHEGIQWVTSINSNQDAELVKNYLHDGIEIRHVKDLSPLNFSLSDDKLLSTVDKIKENQMVSSVLVSNDPIYVDHYNTIFENMWKMGINVNERINQIEKGYRSHIEIIPNAEESLKFVNSLTKNVKNEVLSIVSSYNAISRFETSGGLRIFNKLANDGIKVKLLIPTKLEIQGELKRIVSEYPNIEFRELPFTLPFFIGITIMDKENVTLFEVKDNSAIHYTDAIGLTIHMDVKSIALSYVSIFESLWKQTELYEQLAKNHQIQQEFIHVAAHELRNPVQSLIGFSNILLRMEGPIENHRNYLQAIHRNSRRLKSLVELVLNVAQIDNNSLTLNKEVFDLNESITEIVKDYQNQTKESKEQEHIDIEFLVRPNNANLIVTADRTRIMQVIANLLDNAVKFSKGKEERILICAEKNQYNKHVTVSFIDHGVGIPPEIQPLLFTKFTKTQVGSGLGLYLSKKIVEAHGGRIWAKNNKDGRGATFSFSLPLTHLQ